MIHLLDTDVIINQLHNKDTIKLSSVESLAISVITLGELLYGVNKSPDSSSARSQVYKLVEALSIKIIPISQSIVERFSKLKVELEKKGIKLADFDLLIAATALEHDLILVTVNNRHFSRIPHLKLA